MIKILKLPIIITLFLIIAILVSCGEQKDFIIEPIKNQGSPLVNGYEMWCKIKYPGLVKEEQSIEISFDKMFLPVEMNDIADTIIGQELKISLYRVIYSDVEKSYYQYIDYWEYVFDVQEEIKYEICKFGEINKWFNSTFTDTISIKNFENREHLGNKGKLKYYFKITPTTDEEVFYLKYGFKNPPTIWTSYVLGASFSIVNNKIKFSENN